ncbi:germination protein YpeB [Bacillus sp. T33-2]|uniref:germination protein YpeB n=1 Tax=Bacillus sp. T33-2 TaxID=2054168 RepID=UPI000C793C4E|nr:germination protein YpeB [Bacillus sp. T33-2]PLR99766.1 germination protein YpeB [Bacillus sp. T33-2]
MIRGILIGVLAVALIGTGYWGYQEHHDKNVVLQNAENGYQRAFHDLAYQVDILHDKIGTSLAMNSRSSLSPSLAEVWKITSEAHNDVGQLPLTLLPFNKTEEFLANIGNFSYRAAIRDLDKEPLSDKEYQTLQTLYKQSADIQNELRRVQHMVIANDLRWMDVEAALAAGNEPGDNTIVNGFKTVEKTVEGYTETEFGPANVNMQKPDENFNRVTGSKISKAEAVQIAKRYAELGNDANVKVVENGKGSDFGFFSVSVENPKSREEVNMDITKKGGHPIWFIHSRDVGKQAISLNDASNRASHYLKQNGYNDLSLLESAQYDNVGMFTFTSVQDGVRIYPDSIKVQVALDNGKITEYSADDYLRSHRDRNIEKPAISAQEARAKLNKNVKVMEERQAVIVNDLNEEVLCHEFMGVLGDDTFRIYINAKTGDEEKVEKLQNAEQAYTGAG